MDLLKADEFGQDSRIASLSLKAGTVRIDESIVPRHRGWLPTARVALTPWLFAVTVTTSPVLVPDPLADLRRSGAVSALTSLRPARRRSISLREARALALAVYDETELRLRRERVEEYRFLLAFEDDGIAVA